MNITQIAIFVVAILLIALGIYLLYRRFRQKPLSEPRLTPAAGFPTIDTERPYIPEPLATFTDDAAAPWAFIERHAAPSTGFPIEPFHPKLSHLYPQVSHAFGTATPSSSTFLLHGAPNCLNAKITRPVLLIHGANDDATRRYGYPLSPSHPEHNRQTGLAPYLAQRGFSVFGLSFSHYHGCNVHQGQQVANAILRIRKLLNKENDPTFSVDLITYSKGAMAARCYVQSARDFLFANHLTPYRDDVHRVIFQVGPLGGLDTPFRSYMYNLFCKSQEVPAPLGVKWQTIYARRVDSGPDYIDSGCWPGQLQMLHDLRSLGVGYGFSNWTLDANWSMRALRDGGSTFFLESIGIEEARKRGYQLIERLNTRGFPEDVEFAVVAGDHPVLYHEGVHSFNMPIGVELGGRSDGLLFHSSATHTAGLARQGARCVGKKTFKLNHLDVSRSDEVFEHVSDLLQRS